MINLISLPTSYSNIPQIDNCIIKNLLLNDNIDSVHYDVGNLFLINCLTSEYIINKYKKQYKKLESENKNIINNTDKTILNLTQKNLPHKNINIDENLNFQKILNFISKCNNLEWSSRNILYKKRIETIDSLIEFCKSDDFDIFDDVFADIVTHFRDQDIFYFAVKYAYQIPIALRYINKIKNSYSIQP